MMAVIPHHPFQIEDILKEDRFGSLNHLVKFTFEWPLIKPSIFLVFQLSHAV